MTTAIADPRPSVAVAVAQRNVRLAIAHLGAARRTVNSTRTKYEDAQVQCRTAEENLQLAQDELILAK